MTPEQIQEQKDQIKAEQDKLAADQKAHADAVAAFSEQQIASRKADDVAFADSLIQAGRLLPAHKTAVVELLGTISNSEAEIQFAEGEDKISARDSFRKFLEAQPVAVDFKEKSQDDGHRSDDALDANTIRNEAVAYMNEQAAKGNKVTEVQAVRHIQKTRAA